MADTGYQHQQQPAQQQPNGDANGAAGNASYGNMGTYSGLEAANETGLHPVEAYPHELSTEKLGSTGSPYSNSPGSQGQFTPHSHQAGPVPETYQHQPAAAGPYPYDSQETSPKEEPRIFGLRRPTFFLSLSNVVLIIAIIIVGVVPSQINKNNNNSTATCTSSQGSSGTTSGSSDSTNTASPKVCFQTTTSAPSQFGSPTVDCPRANNETTRYAVPGTNLTFARTCGIDYTGNDMGRFPVVTMADCLVLCAQLNLYPSSTLGRCLGVSWVFGDGPQGKGVSYCYPKSSVSDGSSARGDTESARLLAA